MELVLRMDDKAGQRVLRGRLDVSVVMGNDGLWKEASDIWMSVIMQ
jgi:hypothetical protein